MPIDNTRDFLPGGMFEWINDPSFSPGGVKDRVDSRDFEYKEVGQATTPFDWNKGYDVELELSSVLNKPNFKLPVKNQNGSFSCGGQAWSTYSGVLEAIATGSFEERSAKFFYAQTYQQGGGSTGRDNAEIYKKQGAAREAVLTSYQNGNPPSESFITRGQDITLSTRNDALSNKALSYAQVGTVIDEAARVMRDNHGSVIGITGQNNGTWASAFPTSPTSNQGLWNHWIYAGKAKKINGIKHIGILNSWGDTVGEQGWQWISEAYFTKKINGISMIWSNWSHVIALVPPPVFKHNFLIDMKYGQTSDEVKALQTVLKMDGTFSATVNPTGYYGQITAQAVLAFQLKYQIIKIPSESDNGKVVGPKTRQVLNSLFGY
jgi:hypothetical protein